MANCDKLLAKIEKKKAKGTKRADKSLLKLQSKYVRKCADETGLSVLSPDIAAAIAAQPSPPMHQSEADAAGSSTIWWVGGGLVVGALALVAVLSK